MRNTYDKTIWEDNKTPVNAENLNKIENALDELYSGSVGISQLKEGKGVDIKVNDFREVEISANSNEINELVEHNKYIEGNGINLKELTPPPFPPIVPNPDTTIDDYWGIDDAINPSSKPLPPLHPPTEISIDNDYVNDIVKHNKYNGINGVIVEKIEDTDEEPTEKDELVKDEYSIKADVDYIDKNITHPNYVGIRGVKVRKIELDQIFPELDIDERTKAVYLDEDYLNDFAIDIQKIAEKLNITPIVEYSAGEGLEILDQEIPPEPEQEVDSPTEEPSESTTDSPSTSDDDPSSSPSDNVTASSSNDDVTASSHSEDVTEPREDQTEQEAVVEELVNEEIGEPHQNVPEKIYKTIRLDEEWLNEKLTNHDPEFNSDPSTGLSITKSELKEGEDVPEAAQYDVNVNKSKLQEFLEVPASPEITGEEDSGIVVTKLEPSPIEPGEGEEEPEYIPIPDRFVISINPEDLREAIGVSDNPTLTTGDGITLETTESEDEYGKPKENWDLGLDTEYINSIVRHKQYTFIGPYFRYREIDDNRGEISIDDAYMTRKIEEIVNRILTAKGLI